MFGDMFNRFKLFNTEPENPVRLPFQNLFQSEEEENPFSNLSQPPVEPQAPPSLMDAYRELVNRKPGVAMQAYQKFLEQGGPSKEDLSPNKLTRLGAILSGSAAAMRNPGSGSHLTSSLLDRHYNRGMERFNREGSRLREGAALEETQSKNTLQAVNSMIEAQNKERDNQRLEKKLESDIKKANLDMEKTQLEIENFGYRWILDKNTGIGGYVKPDGTFKEVGKFDLSTGERIKEDLDKARGRGAITLANQKNLKLFDVPLINARDDRRADRRVKDTLKVEEARQENRKELAEANAKLREKAKLPNTESVNQKLTTNKAKAEALIKSNPTKYADLLDADGLNEDKADTPEYKELFNILYEGFAPGAASTTPAGRVIKR